MEKPEVGQIVYSLNTGNAARNGKRVLTPFVVKKVGRKYFTCGKVDCPGHMDKRYLLSTWEEDTHYSTESILYRNPQEWEDEKSIVFLRNYIKERMNKFISLESLREIEQILRK